MSVTIQNQETPLKDREIPVIEKRLGFKLPEQYKAFLLKNNGGTPSPDTVPYNGEYFDYVSLFYAVRTNAYSNDLFRNIEEYKEYILDHYLPIAESPGGDVYCISLKTDDYGAIYCWDHEEANYGGEPWEENMIKLANSLNEFLESLYENS